MSADLYLLGIAWLLTVLPFWCRNDRVDAKPRNHYWTTTTEVDS